jgi:hypothetical protein
MNIIQGVSQAVQEIKLAYTNPGRGRVNVVLPGIISNSEQVGDVSKIRMTPGEGVMNVAKKYPFPEYEAEVPGIKFNVPNGVCPGEHDHWQEVKLIKKNDAGATYRLNLYVDNCAECLQRFACPIGDPSLRINTGVIVPSIQE